MMGMHYHVLISQKSNRKLDETKLVGRSCPLWFKIHPPQVVEARVVAEVEERNTGSR